MRQFTTANLLTAIAAFAIAFAAIAAVFSARASGSILILLLVIAGSAI